MGDRRNRTRLALENRAFGLGRVVLVEASDLIAELIEEEPGISILVLGAGTGKKGPGPLVSSLAGKLSGKFPIPITVVPGNLSLDQIDSLT